MLKPIRILNVCSYESWGGVENYTCRLASDLTRRGHHIVVACRQTSRIQEVLSENGLPSISFAPHFSSDPFALIRLVAALRQGAFDVIHAHAGFDYRPVLLAARLCHIPVIITRHSIGPIGRHRYPLLFSTSHIIAVSEAVRQALIQQSGLLDERVSRVYAGIDVAPIHPLEGPRTILPQHGVPDESPVFGMINGLNPNKRSETFIKAAGILKDIHPQVRFVLVGDGKERATLEQLTADLALNDHLTFTGFVEDAMAYRREFSAFVSTGESEAFCYSILEAMACKVPVIASNAGGNPEAVLDQETGLLFPVGDEQALAHAMQEIVERPQWAKSLGETGRRRAETVFSRELELDAIEDIYRRAANRSL